MDLATLLVELSKTDRTWRITDGWLRNAEGACPLTAVREWLGQQAHERETKHAGCFCLLGLPNRQIRQVVGAADDWPDASKRLRHELLTACGLEETPHV
jgi:hypothetical protein